MGLGALLCAAPMLAQAVPVVACDGAQRISLRTPVKISAQERTELSTLAPLRIYAVNAPPMTRYDDKRDIYTGIILFPLR